MLSSSLIHEIAEVLDEISEVERFIKEVAGSPNVTAEITSEQDNFTKELEHLQAILKEIRNKIDAEDFIAAALLLPAASLKLDRKPNRREWLSDPKQKIPLIRSDRIHIDMLAAGLPKLIKRWIENLELLSDEKKMPLLSQNNEKTSNLARKYSHTTFSSVPNKVENEHKEENATTNSEGYHRLESDSKPLKSKKSK
jgi:hypothetical protein